MPLSPLKSRLGMGLLVSLAFNLFFVGVLAIPFFVGHHHPLVSMMMPLPDSQRQRDGGIGHSFDRKMIESAVAEAAALSHGELEAAFKELRDGRKEVATALTADPFDLVIFAQATRNFQAKVHDFENLADPILATAAANLPLNQRLGIVPLTVNPSYVMRLARHGNGASDDGKTESQHSPEK